MEKTPERRRALKCRIHPCGELDQYKFVVVCSRYNGQWMFSRHAARDTWETQGGHIEADETPMEAAKRELYEESGAEEAILYPVCDYCGYDDYGFANGVVFVAHVLKLGALPPSEMKETALFEQLPEALTYPAVTPRLCAEAEKLLARYHIP